MKNLLLIISFISLCSNLYSQEVIKEKTISEDKEDAKFYGLGFDHPPYLINVGGNGFVVKYPDKFIRCDDDFNKRWEVPAIKLNKTTNRVAAGIPYVAGNSTTAFDIMAWKIGEEVIEITVAAYNVQDGKSKIHNIPYKCDKYTRVLDFFALNDGLHFLKFTYDPKLKKVAEFLGTIDHNGKVTENKISLPYTDEEVEKNGSFNKFGLEYQYFGIAGDKALVMKRKKYKNSDSKVTEAYVSIGALDKLGNFTPILTKVHPDEKNKLSHTIPVATMDTVNNIIYVAGYLVGHTGFTGIYFLSYDLSSQNTSIKNYVFKDINKEFNLTEKLDENIMFAEVGGYDGFYNDYYINIQPDIYNKMALIKLVKRNDVVLKDGFGYLNINSDGNIVEVVKVTKGKGDNVEKQTLYSDKSKRYYTALDYYLDHYPSDKKRFYGFYLSRNDYSILIEAFESNSRVIGVKLKVR